MREIGQIYESCSSERNKKDLQFDFSSLRSLAAEMMISGFPLELMDGDAAHVPVIWISAVLDQLIQKLGNQRVFVLSVLGLQSSGKSTMLNAMFGLQFAVSAGRCTRGAFMQLVRVSDEMKTQMNIDYVLVVDTEGLRALELAGRSTRDQDNELATFVIGLGNLTLVNIFGENPSEMQDILQIVVQAFMRMKEKENQITEAVKKASEEVDENSGDVDLWLKIFTLKLSAVLIFSEKDLEGVSCDVDVKLLAEPSAQTQQKIMIHNLTVFLSIDLKD
ncbi:hypothetical protein M9458_057359 [Cirrhinus mrigala]|uniref:VLIG-type G domain-containing protein n=1 Tax=Cirrhinus mrigala TaxID=683832 RepID=A0ABD0MCB9_CIRMR